MINNITFIALTTRLCTYWIMTQSPSLRTMVLEDGIGGANLMIFRILHWGFIVIKLE